MWSLHFPRSGSWPGAHRTDPVDPRRSIPTNFGHRHRCPEGRWHGPGSGHRQTGGGGTPGRSVCLGPLWSDEGRRRWCDDRDDRWRQLKTWRSNSDRLFSGGHTTNDPDWIRNQDSRCRNPSHEHRFSGDRCTASQQSGVSDAGDRSGTGDATNPGRGTTRRRTGSRGESHRHTAVDRTAVDRTAVDRTAVDRTADGGTAVVSAHRGRRRSDRTGR